MTAFISCRAAAPICTIATSAKQDQKLSIQSTYPAATLKPPSPPGGRSKYADGCAGMNRRRRSPRLSTNGAMYPCDPAHTKDRALSQSGPVCSDSCLSSSRPFAGLFKSSRQHTRQRRPAWCCSGVVQQWSRQRSGSQKGDRSGCSSGIYFDIPLQTLQAAMPRYLLNYASVQPSSRQFSDRSAPGGISGVTP